jgi:hypothetical protein
MKKLMITTNAGVVKLLALLFVLAAPVLSYGQPPLPDDGGEPIGPDAPFDDKMSLVFLAIGVVFAAVIVMQEVRKRRKLQGTNVK